MSFKHPFAAVILLLCLTVRSEAVIALDALTAGNFTEVGLGGASDNVVDNQANRPDLELVGDGVGLGAFYVAFDGYDTPNDTQDGSMYFRIRVAGENGNSDGVLGGNVYIGIDITGNGALDYMIEHGGSGSTQAISLLRMGAGVDSPDAVVQGTVATYDVGGTATIASVNVGAQNSSFATVKSVDDPNSAFNDGNYADYDLDNGLKGKAPKSADDSALDRFLTFTFDFGVFGEVIRQDFNAGEINGEGKDLGLFDDTYTYSMLVVTSQNANNINSDFGGINDNADGYDPATTFAEQPLRDTDGNVILGSSGEPLAGGGLSAPVTTAGEPGSTGEPVPEPATYALLFGFLTLGYVVSRRRR